MAGSSLASFTAWLTAYGDAWEATDADAAASLFTVGATIQPTPFDELIRGRRLIHEHLVELFAGMSGVSFVAQVLGAGDTYGVAHWRAATSDFALDGVLVAALDERGRCTSLRQWWHASQGGITRRGLARFGSSLQTEVSAGGSHVLASGPIDEIRWERLA